MRAVVCALAALLVACTQVPEPELQIDPASGGAGLSGRYTSDGTTVGFEALRVADADGPELVVDARFFDTGGRTFLLLVGGHRPMRPEWELSDVEVPAEERAASLALVSRLVLALGEAGLPAELEPELAALRSLAGAQEQTEAEHVEAGPPNPRAAVVCDTGYNHAISVRYKSVSALLQNLCPGGQHSATRMCSYRIYSNCSQATYGCKYQNNHGTAWADMSSNSCSWKSGLRSAAYPPYQVCTTVYGIHVCNDDSLLQIRNVQYNNSYSTGMGTLHCNPPSLRCKAPTC